MLLTILQVFFFGSLGIWALIEIISLIMNISRRIKNKKYETDGKDQDL